MLYLETFFRNLYEYVHSFVGENTVITTAIRLKSWNAYITYIRGDTYRFGRAIKSLTFEVLKMYNDCFTVRTDEFDFYPLDIDEATENGVWDNFDYNDYETLSIGIHKIYCDNTTYDNLYHED